MEVKFCIQSVLLFILALQIFEKAITGSAEYDDQFRYCCVPVFSQWIEHPYNELVCYRYWVSSCSYLKSHFIV